MPDATSTDRPQDDCHWCQLRAFPTAKSAPVTIVNTIDKEGLPANFRFLQESVLGRGV